MADERAVTETTGEFAYVLRDGGPVAELEWRPCRLAVTTKRLILSTDGASEELPHARVSIVDPEALSAPTDLTGTVALAVGEATIAIDAGEAFPAAYARGVIDGTVGLVRHPAVVGGVVRDSPWEKARVRVDETRLGIARRDGEPVTVPFEAIARFEGATQTVEGDERPVVQIEHADGGRSVETHLAGTDRQVEALELLVEHTIDRDDPDSLSETERQVLLALYSGVSPFDIPEFVGLDVGEVETIYERLLEVGAVDKVRERTEVALNATGRNMASEAMNEQ